MAIARAGIIPIISGKLGGMEIAATKNGMVLKHPKPPRSLDSIRMYRARSVWAHRNDLWNALTPEEVLAWKKAAETHPRTNRFGDRIYLTAHQLFMTNIMDCTQTVPYPDNLYTHCVQSPPITSFTATLYAGGPYTITIIEPLSAGNYPNYTIWVARFLPNTVNHKPRTWINIGTFMKTGDPSTWYERFIFNKVSLLEGERVALRARSHGIYLWPSQKVELFTTVLPAP